MGKMKTKFVGESDEKKKNKVEKSAVVEEVVAEVADVSSSKGKKVERARGKKYVESKKAFDREKLYGIAEAVKLVKSTSYSKFDGTMELHLIVKKVGTTAQVTLPFQAGKQKKVEIATEDTIVKLKEGKVDFDILVATAAMMPKLVPFARLLGPKGLMPNPKNGTLVADEKKAKAYSTGSILIKTEKEAPLVHTVVGKNSQKDEEIVANAEAILKALGGVKQIVKAYLTSSMSPSVKLVLN